jgi:hypothetical protein
MSDEVIVNDDVIDVSGETNTAIADSGNDVQDNYGAMQNRMASDSPFFDENEGAVVDKDGDVLLNAKTNQPIKSLEEYKALVEQDKASKTTAKPKTEAQPAQKQMAKSFSSYVSGPNGLTPERLQEMAKAGGDYLYKDDLVPKIDATQAQTQKVEELDPIAQVKESRKQWETIAVNPIKEIRDALIAQGADVALVDSTIIGPIMQKQMALVDSQYQTEYEKALRTSIEGKFTPTISKIEDEKLANASNANIQALASKYYPEGGKDAFFSLINGHYDENNVFVRGPAAQVVDLMTVIAADGKQFKTEAERNAAYSNTFRKVTADPAKAKALFDIAHYFWIGKQSVEAKNILFQKGKQAAIDETKRVQRTVKTKPASYNAPSTVDNDEDMPQLLKGAMGLSLKR